MKKFNKKDNEKIDKRHWQEKKIELEDERLKGVLLRLIDAKMELEDLGYELVEWDLSNRFRREVELESIYTHERIKYVF